MNSIFYYVIFYLAVSAAGMYIANKKVVPVVRRQRWLKFFTFILITGTVIASILLDKFIWLAVIIIIAATFELWNVNFKLPVKRYRLFFTTFLLFVIISFGFFHFSSAFLPSSQLFFYFQVFTFDAFCQITGQLFGKHVLSAKISPSKTVEGFIGGIIFCILSALLGRSWVNLPLATAAIIGAFTALTAFSGDMLASYYKRLTNIKDYSNLLPGQGGFLDRFDSLMMTGACYYFLLKIFINAMDGWGIAV